MKITKLQTWLVRPRWAFIEISTDAGISGWGEPVLEGRAATVCECIHEMEPYLIGADPMKIEDLWTVLFRGGFYRGGGILMSAISGIDQALWDIKGKYCNVPVWQLMGGSCAIRCGCTAGWAATAQPMWAALRWKRNSRASPPSR